MKVKPEQVPEKVVKAARRAWGRSTSVPPGADVISAAINAWPGMLTERRARCDAVVLPYNLDADLPQEASDE